MPKIKIKTVSDFAKRQGFKVGDEVLRIGGYDMIDELDYLYYDNERKFSVDILRDGKPHTIKVHKKDGQSLGLEFDIEMKPIVCKNKCIFCFVDQLPKGMRSTLYVKDDDYRYSFMCGSYVTMTNVSEADIERVIRLKLSPLYISVHAWDDDIRTFILKNPNTRKLRDQMRRLGEAGIKMHTQLVVVPDVNDGKVLEDSIRGLHEVEGVETVAVVPVGMTGHRDNLPNLKSVDEQNAKDTIALVERLHREYGGFCWCSDEYYVKAKLPTPSSTYYGAFDQIENGVGLLADFDDNFEYNMSETEDCNLGKKVEFITGVSFAPYLEKYAKRLEEKLGIECKLHAIINNFFGTSVTVAGLVTAGDITAQLKDNPVPDAYVIPDNMLREFTDTFLDNVRVEELSKRLKAPIIVTAHSGSDIVSKIKEFFE